MPAGGPPSTPYPAEEEQPPEMAMQYATEGQPPPYGYAYQQQPPTEGYQFSAQGYMLPAAPAYSPIAGDYQYPAEGQQFYPPYQINQPLDGGLAAQQVQPEAGGDILPAPTDPPKSSFIQSYRSLAYLEADSFLQYARHGADTCSIDFTDRAMMNARDFLKRSQCADGASLWTHIRDTLELILLERPLAPASFLEDFSQRARAARAVPAKKYPRDKVRPLGQARHAFKKIELARKDAPADAVWPGGGGPLIGDDASEDGGEEEEDEGDAGPRAKPPRWQDLNGVNRLLNQAGIGIPADEAFQLTLAMRQLCLDEEVRRVRFWGKIYGTERDYFVLEAELSDNGLNRRLQERDASVLEETEGEALTEEGRPGQDLASSVEEERGARRPVEHAERQRREDEELGEEEGAGPLGEALPPFWTKPPPAFPPLPIIVPKPIVRVPNEPPGVGVNRKVYYVANSPTDEWTALPDATPAQLAAARLVRRFLTGRLRAPVDCSPVFPGVERHLLRAQIARITAATHVSPMGFYSSPEELGEGAEEEEEEELEGEGEGAGRGTVLKENARYRSLPLAELLDPSGGAWLHHTEHILKQGRTKWWNPATADRPEGEEEEEEREEGEEDEDVDPNAPEPETGPALLMPLSEDVSVEMAPVWTFRAGCSVLAPLWGSALARSNLWPGAWAFSAGALVVNVYVGWGAKAVAHSFTPTLPGPPQREYPVGPEILEQRDPTPEDEEEWRLAHMPPPKLEFGEEEGLFEEDEMDVQDLEDL